MKFHAPSHAHPGSCPGCTTDAVKHGNDVPDVSRATRKFCTVKLNVGYAFAVLQEHQQKVIDAMANDREAAAELEQLAADLFSLLEVIEKEGK